MSGKYKPKYTRIAQLKTPEDFMLYLENNGAKMPFEPEIEIGTDSPQAKAYVLKNGKRIGNRFCILPMEGWDGTTDGRPTAHTKRRWENFAKSGAKLLWGCEAVAVQADGRANPNQLMLNQQTKGDFQELLDLLQSTHQEQFGSIEDLYIGLQLTHSGRFCKPNSKTQMEPKILYPHPVLNAKFGLKEDYPLLTDEEIYRLISSYIDAAVIAWEIGFHFVDIKHCHGYLGHEFLTAVDRDGDFGGSFENRTRFLRLIVEGIKEKAPGLDIGIRLSAFDFVPFVKGEEQIGVPAKDSYKHAFGGTKDGLGIDLKEPIAFLQLAESLGIELICLTAGSPYYNPHIIRPALFPPSDGYLPPEEPLLGVSRQIQVTGELKKHFPNLCITGSGYSYLQEWLPNVGQAVLRQGLTDFVGLGRMVLSYPEMPADILSGQVLKRNKICRTFSDCTTAPRNGMISGCFPLDPYYKEMQEAKDLKTLKAEL